jgi:hypothetical protein
MLTLRLTSYQNLMGRCPDSLGARLRTLFWIAATSFVFPGALFPSMLLSSHLTHSTVASHLQHCTAHSPLHLQLLCCCIPGICQHLFVDHCYCVCSP